MTAPSTPLQLSGHTTRPRHESIPATHDALDDCGALLEDMHEFSNRMTTYRFELPRAEVARLAAALRAAGFVLEPDDPTAAAASIVADADDFIVATLALTFPAEDGNRRNPNPDLG